MTRSAWVSILLTCAVFFQNGAPVIPPIQPQDRLALWESPSMGRLHSEFCGLINRTRTMNWMVHWTWHF